MSTPEGTYRAEMFMRTLPVRGIPPRGSFQDRVAQEMLYRERRREVAGHVYQAQFLATGLGISQGLFSLWTQSYEDEVSHHNYRPNVIAEKKRMLEAFAARRALQTSQVKKVEEYSVKSAKDLLPYTKEERAKIAERLRQRELAAASRGGTP